MTRPSEKLGTPPLDAAAEPDSRVNVRRASLSASTVETTTVRFETPFAAGDVIADKYEVVDVLGAGGVAYVISAIHLELGELVALKFLRPESLALEDVVARFASEARAVARVKSEHVAHVYDVGTLPDGAPFIVMEHLEGKDLADVLAERGPLPLKVAVDYVMQACEALACAHAAGIVHRDIKPENLFLAQRAASVEVVKVLDFGISKTALGVESAERKFAKTMLPMGTPGYMSPEQVRACGNVDARTDIWALGCVLYELLTGVCAFDAPTQMQLGAAILERNARPLSKFLPDAPPELEAIIDKCLQKEVDNRFQDIAELARALYPFGPRRSRISAEKCSQVLHGAGTHVEFTSVAPPPSISSRAETPTTLLRTSSPAAISVAEPARQGQRPRRYLPYAAMVVGAIAAAVWGFRAGSGAADVSTSPAVAAAAPAVLPAAPAPTAPLSPEPVATSQPADEARPEPSASAAPAKKARTRSAGRVAASRPAAAKTATLAKTGAPAPKARPALDDQEPDVGY